MAKPLSWLPRLKQIRDAVERSARSHYGREDLEELFRLKPRAAGNLLKLLPKQSAFGAHLVERTHLLDFLEGVRNTDDVPAFMDELRQKGMQLSRRKLRSLVREDEMPTTLAGLPSNIQLERGRMVVTFSSIEEFAQTLVYFSSALHSQLDEFARLYEPPQDTTKEDAATADLRGMMARLRADQDRHAQKENGAPESTPSFPHVLVDRL